MQNKLRLGLLALLAAVAVLPVSAEDWPRWRGPDLNGISKERGWTTAWPKDGPKQLWKAGVGLGFSSVAVADGRVFTMGNSDNTDTVYGLNADTGAVVWKHSYKCVLDPRFYEGGPSATPTVEGDRVYTLSKRGHVFCFDTATGKIAWQKNVAEELGVKLDMDDQAPWWGFAGSPLVRGDLLILNLGSDGTALNKKDGKVVWSNGRGLAGYSTPVPFKHLGRDAILLAVAQSIVAVAEKDGKELWRLPWKTSYDVNGADPILSGDKLFISSGYGHGCTLLELKAGGFTKLYENKVMKNQFNPSVLIGGHLYGIDGNTGSKDTGLRCIDLATGTSKWFEQSIGSGALMAAGNKLIVQGDKGELVIAEATPEAFKPLARAQVLGGKCWTAPVLANGRIYCRNAKGDLVCVEVRGGPVAGLNLN